LPFNPPLVPGAVLGANLLLAGAGQHCMANHAATHWTTTALIGAVVSSSVRQLMRGTQLALPGSRLSAFRTLRIGNLPLGSALADQVFNE